MAAISTPMPREIAVEGEDGREIAEQRMFSEKEAYAIAADRVKTELAASNVTIETLTAEKLVVETAAAALQDKVDIAEAGKVAAEVELAAYKAADVEAKEVAARVETRTAAVREAAKHLPDEFFTPERALAWAQKTDEEFATYVAELAEVSKGPIVGKRETAMKGASVPGTPAKGNAFFAHGKGR